MNAPTPKQEPSMLPEAKIWEIAEFWSLRYQKREALGFARQIESEVHAGLAAQAVPVGWKLVPLDATPAMCDNGVKRMFADKRYSAAWEDVFFNAWRDMLLAAPPAPQEPADHSDLIARLERMRGPFLGDGINPGVTITELIAALRPQAGQKEVGA